MNLKIYPKPLKGIVDAPPSKSLTHRALICAAFAQSKSVIFNPLIAIDTEATINVLKTLGANFIITENKIEVLPVKSNHLQKPYFDANESASTMRMLLPLISLFADEFSFTGSPVLINRVFTDDLKSLEELDFERYQTAIKVKGKLSKSDYYLSGKNTTQLISGMILALPFLPKGTLLHLNDINLSNPYLEMTVYIGRYFGMEYVIDLNNQTIGIKDNHPYFAREITIEGDYSNAAFWLGAACFNQDIKVGNLEKNSVQGDRKFIDFLKQLGVEFCYDGQLYQFSSCLYANAQIDITETPDLGPILAAVASLGSKTVIISGIEKLEYKESNRNLAIYDGLKKLGADIVLLKDKMIINGKPYLEGNCEVDSYNDHRIVMALTAISSKVLKPYVISSYRVVNKSYPNFFEEFQKLGGKVEYDENIEC